MKTGCFKQINEHKMNGYISISLHSSNNDFVKFDYKSLVPNWKLIENLHKKIISEQEFIHFYKQQLYLMNPGDLYVDLQNLVSGYEPIIMTNVSKKKFCHRHIVAEWLENELGIIIEEFKVGKVTRSQGYMKKKSNPTLF
tara:strand:+ start:113 stop:532 length:420 start_codon:yes stop_codon:yes gene_type:complete